MQNDGTQRHDREPVISQPLVSEARSSEAHGVWTEAVHSARPLVESRLQLAPASSAAELTV